MLQRYIPYTALIGGNDVIGFDITIHYWRILIVKFVFVFFYFFLKGGVSYVFTESTQMYFSVIVQMSIGNERKKKF